MSQLMAQHTDVSQEGVDLCLTKKYVIARANHKNLLNKRAELISKCCHRNKNILKNIK